MEKNLPRTVRRLLDICRTRKMAGMAVAVVLVAGGITTAVVLGRRPADSVAGIGGSDLSSIERLPQVQLQENKDWVPLFYSAHVIGKGETISNIAEKYGVTVDTLVSFNGIQNTRALHAGSAVKVPNQDGILYSVRKRDTIDSIAKAYGLDIARFRWLNGIEGDTIAAGRVVFLPKVRMNEQELRRINGDLFIFPVRGGYISSPFGFREDPFTGERGFHNGVDIACPWGTPIHASMAGRVIVVGYDPSYGNYVMISHHGGYRTLYMHMSSFSVRQGEHVEQGDTIGHVGTTGHSTGPHVHFSMSQYGTYFNPLKVLYHS